jgi:hypothetical protein
MKTRLLTLSIAFLAINFVNAQETIKDATLKSASVSERNDSIALGQPTQQEPKKADAKTDKKESKSEGQNKMAINEQGVNKTKPKARKSTSAGTDSTKSTEKKK